MPTAPSADNMCRVFIPGWDNMGKEAQLRDKARFFKTGQGLTEEQWIDYQAQLQAGCAGGGSDLDPTRMLLVEGGCDAFQPFQRKVWSTWIFGYRLTAACPVMLPMGRGK